MSGARLTVRRRRARAIQYGGPAREILLPGWEWKVSGPAGEILDSGRTSTHLAALAQGRDALGDALAA